MADFSTGTFTDGELARKHGVSREQIGRRRSSDRRKDPDAWPKVSQAIVREVTQAKVSQIVNEAVTARSDKFTEVVLAAAEVNKQVIMGHRQDAANLRQLVGRLTNEIALSNLLAGEMELLAQIVAGSGAEPADEAKARVTVMKALGMGQRVSSLKALSESLKNLIAIEREAYNIAPNDGKPKDAADLSEDELSRKLAKFGITVPH